MVISVSIELVLGMVIALGHAPGALRPRGRPHRGPDPVRDHHRGRRLRPGSSPSPPKRASSTPGSAPTKTGSPSAASSLSVIILAEVWKTTPFMALLLLAGLVSSRRALEAAKVDGAAALAAFRRITLPHEAAHPRRGALPPLDAFRVFDIVFLMTRGAHNTETCRSSGYNQLVKRLNLGRLRGLGADLPLRRARRVRSSSGLVVDRPSDEAGRNEHGRHSTANGAVDRATAVLVLVFALLPVVWIVSLSLKDPDLTDSDFVPHFRHVDSYPSLFDRTSFPPALAAHRIALITTLIALLAAPAAYAIARLDFPGKSACSAAALASRCSGRSPSSARSSSSGGASASTTPTRPDHPVPDLHAPARDLGADRFLP